MRSRSLLTVPGDHPSFMMIPGQGRPGTIGMNLIVTDLTDQSTDLWTALGGRYLRDVVRRLGATVDPDMYQIYYSDVANGGENAGGSNYMYQIADPELDQLIMDARATTDQTYRKAMYKACLDIVIDWAPAQIPVYQRQNGIVFRARQHGHCDSPTSPPSTPG